MKVEILFNNQFAISPLGESRRWWPGALWFWCEQSIWACLIMHSVGRYRWYQPASKEYKENKELAARASESVLRIFLALFTLGLFSWSCRMGVLRWKRPIRRLLQVTRPRPFPPTAKLRHAEAPGNVGGQMENGVRVAVMGSRDARRTERGSFFLPSRLPLALKTSRGASCVFLHPLPSTLAIARSLFRPTLLAPLFFAASSHSLSNSKLSQTKALQDGAASFFDPFLNFASFPRQMACDKTPASLLEKLATDQLAWKMSHGLFRAQLHRQLLFPLLLTPRALYLHLS